jgi:hypothetical protein
MTYKAEIKIKLPSCNDYINLCRGNKYAAAEMKRTLEDEIFFILKIYHNFKIRLGLNLLGLNLINEEIMITSVSQKNSF